MVASSVCGAIITVVWANVAINRDFVSFLQRISIGFGIVGVLIYGLGWLVRIVGYRVVTDPDAFMPGLLEFILAIGIAAASICVALISSMLAYLVRFNRSHRST